MWVRPALSLRVDIAVRLQRTDVLWHMVAPPPPPPAPPVPGVPPTPKVAPTPRPPRPPQPPVAAPAPPQPMPPAVPPAMLPQPMWYTDAISADDDLRVLALGGLLRTDPQKVVPMLGQIALKSGNEKSSVAAVFVLAQSALPEAHETVLRLAKEAAGPVRVAAVRDLGRFGGPEVSKELMTVYVNADLPVRSQIVQSLGERAETTALTTIVRSEKDVQIRRRALINLGKAGGAAQLAAMYKAASVADKRHIIGGLGLARADGELIRIAEAEQTAAGAALRQEALMQLRLIGTPRAKEYLQKVNESR
jgi:hypothetical protein